MRVITNRRLVEFSNVFNIGGNKYRLIVFLHAAYQLAYIKYVLTHTAYDKGDWKK